MNVKLILICLLFPLLAIGQEIDSKKLEQREGVLFEAGKKKPFSGKSLTYHPNGNKQTSTEYKEGRPEGKVEGWYASGAKQIEGQVVKGQQSGKWTAWYENGNKLRQGSFVGGKEEGEFTWWFENGKVSKRGIYRSGIADGKWEWYYENGQKKQEGILRGEKNDGTWKDWYEDGTQKMVGSFKNGVKDGDWTWWNDKGNVVTQKKYKEGILLEGTEDLDTYLEKMSFSLNERDFKSALSNIEKAISTVDDKSETNPVYLGLALYHAKVYSLFQHLDEAERVLLKATGLPDKDVAVIVNSNYPPAVEELKVLAHRIGSYPETKAKVGPHITLGLIYNILGDTVNLKKEQQLMMERSGNSDRVIQISLELYRIRAVKENTYGEIRHLEEQIRKEGQTRENQLQMAGWLLLVGRLKEAGLIAEKYLASMKEYEAKILAINPAAFDE